MIMDWLLSGGMIRICPSLRTSTRKPCSLALSRRRPISFFQEAATLAVPPRRVEEGNGHEVLAGHLATVHAIVGAGAVFNLAA